MIIYKITNLVNGKIYIGQTSGTLKDRWLKHCSNSSNCVKLKNAINKYGRHNFKIEKLYKVKTKEELNKLEKITISKYDSINSGYNLTTGGDSFNHSEETKNKISKAQIGGKRSKKAKENMSKSAMGKIISKAHRENISNTLINKGNGKPIICVETGAEYRNANDAAKKLNLNHGNLSKVLNGKQKTTGGLSFVYK